MKTKTLIIVAAAFGLAGLANAEEGKRPIRPDNRVDRPLPPEVIEKFDKDGDGKLNEEEREAAKQAMKEKHEAHKKEILAKYDTDGDGELSEDERKAMWKDKAKEFDKDGDGELSDEEKKAMREALEKRGGPRGPGGPDKRREHKEKREGEDKGDKEEKEAPGVLGE